MSVCRAAVNLITRDKRESAHMGVRHFARSFTQRAVGTGERSAVCPGAVRTPDPAGVLPQSFEEVSVEVTVGLSISYVPCPAASA